MRLEKKGSLSILQVATLNQPIRADIGYGPIETVIYNIDKGLHQLNHRSMVVCSGDSIITGEKNVTIEKSFKEYWSEDTQEQRDKMEMHLVLALERASKGDIDIVHLHDAEMVRCFYQRSLKSPVPIVMTLHVPAAEYLPFKRWSGTLKPSGEVHFVPISAYQRNEHYGLGNLMNVIHHGVDIENYPYENDSNRDNYLFSIARITDVKGQDKAIEVARKSGQKLIIAGNVQNKLKDKAYFEQLKKSIDLCVEAGTYSENDYYKKVIKPILASSAQIVYIGEINREQAKLWYVHAKATLFPIQWGEPFGLVMIESMACGTPVIAFKKGSVPEIIVHGKTGLIVNTVEEMIEAVKQIDAIDPAVCRQYIEKHFSIKSMAEKYVKLYHWVLGNSIKMNYPAARAVATRQLEKLGLLQHVQEVKAVTKIKEASLLT